MGEKEKWVLGELQKILEKSEYRMGALVLTCAPEPGRGDVRIVGVVAMKDASVELAPDLTEMPKRLRAIAEDIENVVAGRAELPRQR